MVTLTINGEKRDVSARTLAETLRELEWHDRRCATMVNGRIVRRDARSATDVSAGDEIEIIAMVGGG